MIRPISRWIMIHATASLEIIRQYTYLLHDLGTYLVCVTIENLKCDLCCKKWLIHQPFISLAGAALEPPATHSAWDLQIVGRDLFVLSSFFLTSYCTYPTLVRRSTQHGSWISD